MQNKDKGIIHALRVQKREHVYLIIFSATKWRKATRLPRLFSENPELNFDELDRKIAVKIIKRCTIK